MDASLLNQVTNAIKSKENWEPESILLNTTIGRINLMDYLYGGKAGKTTLLFDNSPTDINPSLKEDRRKIIKALRNACSDAGFEVQCKGWQNERLRLNFVCSRGQVFESQKKSDVERNGHTSKPLFEHEKCSFCFTIHWFTEQKCWGIKGGNGCRFHCGHVKKGKEEVRRLTSDFAEEQLQVVKDCLSVMIGTGPAGALAKKQTGLLLSRYQLYKLGLGSTYDTQYVESNPTGTDNSTPASRLVEYLQSNPKLTYVLLFDHVDSKLLTVRKPSKKELGTRQVEDPTVVIEEPTATDYIESLRKSLVVEDNQKFLLAAAWISDDERCMVSKFPQVLGVDVTEQTNKEKRPLIILAGLKGDNTTFTAARALLPSGQRWVFKWFFEVALPTLLPWKTRLQNTVMFTDGDELEYSAFTNAMEDHFPNSCHHLCLWHLFHRNLKQKSGYPCVSHLSQESATFISVVEAWIKSWFFYVETNDEYQMSKNLLLLFLNSPPSDVSQANICHITDWIRVSLETHEKKWLHSHFLYKQTFGRQSTQFVEAENSVLKNNLLGTKPNQSIDTCAQVQTALSDRRLSINNKISASRVDQKRVKDIAAGFEDINGSINDDAAKKVIAQYNCAKNYDICRQSESSFMVKHKCYEAKASPTYLEKSKYISYMVPHFERTRLVTVAISSGRHHLGCSCGFFKRMGFPCRHMNSVLKRKPIPSDLLLRYHVSFHYFYQKSGYSDTTALFDQILADSVEGPIVTMSDFKHIMIAETISNSFTETLPGKPPIISKHCHWHRCFQDQQEEPSVSEDFYQSQGSTNVSLAFSQKIGFSQQQLMEESEDDDLFSDQENDPFSQSTTTRKRSKHLYVFGEMNPTFQSMLKNAESNKDAFLLLNHGLKKLLAQSQQIIALQKKAKVGGDITSSCLEMESKRVHKRKKAIREWNSHI